MSTCLGKVELTGKKKKINYVLYVIFHEFLETSFGFLNVLKWVNNDPSCN